MADNYAKYAISKTTLDSIAAQTMTLSGTDAAMTTDQIRQAVVDANVEVAAQAQKIAAISDVLTEKGSESSEVGDNATTPIKQNTNDLDALLAKAQALPDKVVLQEKTVTPSTSVQEVLPDDDFDAMSKVTVNAMPTATQATPSISVNSSGLITASATQSAGYVVAGTKSGTKQLTTQAAKTVTPTTSEQTVVAAGRYTTGAIKVAKIPSDYIKPSGTKSITENGTHDVKSYASVNVNVNVTGSSLVSFNLVNGGGTHVLYVNENDQIVQAVQSGTYQAKGGILIHTYVSSYDYSKGLLSSLNVDNYWEYMMVAFEDGFTLTLDT